MFQATMTQVLVLKKIIDSLKDLVSEVNLEADSEGLSLQAMDSAHVSLVSLKVKENAFEEYLCDKNITLGLNLSDLAKILKLAKTDDTLILKAEENNSYLDITFENKRTQKKAEFQVTLLNLDIQSLGIPDTEYPTHISMSSGEFSSLCKDFTQLSESLKISVENDEAVFSISGKAGLGKITMKNNNAEKLEDQVTIVCNESVACSYGLQYLNSFTKASSLSGIVTLYISTKFPLMIEYEIQDIGFIKYYLAPKMEDDAVEEH